MYGGACTWLYIVCMCVMMAVAGGVMSACWVSVEMSALWDECNLEVKHACRCVQ